MRTIYIEPNEEITSVIDRLNEAESNEINLVVPSGAQIWQSSINLKLLKREIDGLAKQIVLVTTDDLGKEMAEKIGFTVKKERDLPTQIIREDEDFNNEQTKEEESKDMIDLLVKELDAEKNKPAKKNFFSWPKTKKEPRKKMIDIVNPVGDGENKSVYQPTEPEVKVKKIPVFKTIEKEEIPKEKIIQEPIIKEEIIREYPQPIEKTFRFKWSKILIGFVGLAFLAGGVIAYLALPNTEIDIFPKKEKANFDLSVVGTQSISQPDQILNKIPLQEIEAKKIKSKEFASTGEKQLNEKARGTLTIYNEYSSSPQTLVVTTRFESSEGKIFRIERNITIPGAKIEEGKIIASSIETEVAADQPGVEYNIGPSNFTIPGFKGTAKYARFYAKSKTVMTGGSTEKVKIVTADDLKKAEENLTAELKKEIEAVFQEQAPAGLKLVEGGLKEEITKKSFSVEEEARADKFILEIELTMRGLFFKEDDLKNLADFNLASQITENKQPLSSTQKITQDKPIIDWQKKEVIFSLHIEEEVAWQIDSQRLKENLAGKEETEVRKYLAELPAVEKAKVTFWPFWVKRVPLQKEKIKIIVNY